MNATITSVIEPKVLGKNINDQFAFVKKTIIGFDPAGGCTVLDTIITPSETASASAILHHCGPIKCKHASPIKVENKCPAMTFLGCEKGLSGYPNINTQEAPNEPMIKG